MTYCTKNIIIAAALMVFAIPFKKAFSQETKKPPGVVISHFPASGKRFVGSPSIAILPNGSYIASHDLFGPNANASKNALTLIFESKDKGKSWHKITELNQFWSGLFVFEGDLYLMGAKNEEGDCIIRRSKDGGHTWTKADGPENGLLIKAQNGNGYHTSAMPVLDANGRLWRGMEEVKQGGPWGGFKAFLLSIDKNTDLLNASDWVISNKLEFDKNQTANGTTWLEGNAVVNPKGQVFDMLRVHFQGDSIAALISASADGKQLAFNPNTGFVNLPGAAKKFSVQKDPKTKKYYALSNAVPKEFLGGNLERTRNTLYLLSSDDLITWKKCTVILQSSNIAKHGFQYPDWKFDGKDIVFVSRTAYDDEFGGADSQHNANYLTFHRIKNYKKYCK